MHCSPRGQSCSSGEQQKDSPGAQLPAVVEPPEDEVPSVARVVPVEVLAAVVDAPVVDVVPLVVAVPAEVV